MASADHYGFDRDPGDSAWSSFPDEIFCFLHLMPDASELHPLLIFIICFLLIAKY